MPKGRKRSPQDSIDSILLAISRRENIDPEIMSHYLDRLDEEWTHGAREKVLRLLRTSDPAAHTAAILIFSELATEFDLEEIEDVVADPTVSDLAKLSLAPVLKELRSEMADDVLMEYLNDPEAAMQQMQLRLLELMGKSELGVETVLEDVLAMPLERRLNFVAWLGNSYDARAANMLIPLLENSNSKVVEAAIKALEQLGSIASAHSLPALNYLINHTSKREIKQQARAALGRLTMQLAPGEADEEALIQAVQSRLPFHDARVSYIDGVGAQMIMLSWERPDGLLKGVNVLYEDTWGIKDCYGTDEMKPERWRDIVNEAGTRDYSSFRVPLEFARALIAEARAINKQTRHKVPIAYSIWRPLIEGEEKATQDARQAPVSTKLDAPALTSDVQRLAQRGNSLFNLPEFGSWMFEPTEAIQPFVDRYWGRHNPLDLPFPQANTNGRRRAGAQARKKQQKANMDEVINAAIVELIDEDWRALYEARLLRQAAILQFADRREDAALVQAVAAALHPTSPVAPQEQPFVRALMRYSIEQGPIRALAAALESGRLGPFPFDLFPEK